jgi:hypothetical protein
MKTKKNPPVTVTIARTAIPVDASNSRRRKMTFYIRARDAAGCITLRRDTQEAAVKKAEELRDSGYFDIEITEEADAKVA